VKPISNLTKNQPEKRSWQYSEMAEKRQRSQLKAEEERKRRKLKKYGRK